MGVGGARCGERVCWGLTADKESGFSWHWEAGGVTKALTGLLTSPATQGQEHPPSPDRQEEGKTDTRRGIQTSCRTEDVEGGLGSTK